MATENKAVMVYLPPELETFVGRYCEQNKLIFTKDGREQPRLGTGILRLLSDMASGAATVKDSPDPTVKDLSKLENRLETLEGALATIPALRSELMGEIESLKKL
jgi:hypothetical protein